MIVQCDKCKTKFRIADEKVAASGVKVRCSRCAHVFMVQRDPSLGPPASSNDVERALNQAGLGLPSDGNIPTVATAIPTALQQHHPSQQSPSMPSQHSSLPSFPDRPSSGPRTHNANNPFESPHAMPNAPTIPNQARPGLPPSAPTDVYPIPSLVPAAATTKDAMIALGFAAAPDANAESRAMQFDEESTATFTAASLLPPPKKNDAATTRARAPGAAMSFDDLEVQNRFPDPEPVSTFDELFGKEPPTQIGARPHFDPESIPSNPSAPSLESLRQMEMRMETHKSNPSMDMMRSNPQMETIRPGSGIETLRSSPALTALKSNPAMQKHPEPLTPPRSNPALAALAAAEVGTPADPLTSPFFPPPTGIPGLGTNTNLQAIMHVQSDGRNGHGGLSSQDLGDIPGLIPPATDDPFAGLDLDGPAYGGGDLGEDSNAETRAVGADNPMNPAAMLAKIELGRSAGVPSHFESNLATTRVATALLTDNNASTDDLMSSIDGPKRWPTYVGLVLGLAVTAAALIGPAQGQLSQLGPEDIVALVSPPVSEPIDTSVAEVQPKNAQVTLYPGKGGKMLLVVAGEAYNDGDAPISGLEAVASVRNGGEVIEQREGWVGLTLEEDALSKISNAAELEVAIADALRASSVPLKDRSLQPGESLPFMVIFPNPPAELERRGFRVDFRRGSMSATRAP